MKSVGVTFSHEGELVKVYQCRYCGTRSREREEIKRCEEICKEVIIKQE